MITVEELSKANKSLDSIPVKGKDYVLVNSRVAAFRSICPSGSITTSIIPELSGNGVVTMKAVVADEDGRVLASGLAQEKESSSYINKTSYIENCETSAVGRALGMLGIGSKDSIASAEELANAIMNKQTNREKLLAFCSEKGLALQDISKDYEIVKGMPDEKYKEVLEALQKKYAK